MFAHSDKHIENARTVASIFYKCLKVAYELDVI